MINSARFKRIINLWEMDFLACLSVFVIQNVIMEDVAADVVDS